MRWLIVLSILVPSLAAADVPTKLAAKSTSLLGDHLAVALPAGMKLEARGHDIMSADESGDDETRAVLDAGDARFVMMAYERYATAGADFKAAVTVDAKDQTPGVPIDAVAVAKPLVAFAATPAVSTTEDANLVYAAWFASADGSVQLIAFFVNPAGAKFFDQWVALAKKIAASATAGKRVLAAKAGDRTLENMLVTVPDGWVTSSQPGPDFVVFHLRKVAVLGATAPTCGIYLGGYASYQWSQAGVDKATIKTVPGKLLGGAVDWNVWGDGHRAVTEAMAKTTGGGTAHVFCTAATAGELPALRTLAETLRTK